MSTKKIGDSKVESSQPINKKDPALDNLIREKQLKSTAGKKVSTGKSQTKKIIETESKTNVSAGTSLEYRLKRLIYYMGYFPKVGIIMKTSQDETAVTITDLDVLGIYMHKDFTSKSIWVDCKSGRAKVHERISWIKGIMNTVQINDAIFVKGGVRTEVKQYARKYGIQILDLKIIEKLENTYNVAKEDWSGSWNPHTQHNQINSLSKMAVPTNEIYRKIANFISSDYWILDNYSRIKKIVTAIRELSSVLNMPIAEEQIKTTKWAINELVSLFLLTTFNICKELYYFSDSEKSETIYEALSAGDITIKKRKEIFDAAFRVAYSMVKSQIPEFTPPAKMPPINLNPPRYTEAFSDLVLRITSNPLDYYDLLRFIDYVLMEFDLQSQRIDHEKLKKMFTNYDDLIKGAKTYLHFICQVTGVPRSYFQLI